MPTFTAIALDTLLEPGASKPVDKTIPRPVPRLRPNQKLERRNSASVVERRPVRPQITPSLYATPETTPLPDSPTSFPPSPYIVNHKRRGPRLLKSSSESNVGNCISASDAGKVISEGTKSDTKVFGSVLVATVEPNFESPVNGCSDCGRVESKSWNGGRGSNADETGSDSVSSGSVKLPDLPKPVRSTSERESDREDFFDPQDSMSVTSNTDVEDNADGEQSTQFASSAGEFFDAWEELSSESGSQHSSLRDVETELRELRLSVLLEIERRKQAEEALSNMQKQWDDIQHHLSLEGLTFPADAATTGEELCRQVYLARFVSNSIGRGIARAEMEAEMEAQIEAKNFEITRLGDKLRNYEAMNQEMVQRNRDVLDNSRRERTRRERRQRWIWGSVAAALSLGAATLAYPYLPSGASSSSNSEVAQSEDGGN